jgi:hypothetical protein
MYAALLSRWARRVARKVEGWKIWKSSYSCPYLFCKLSWGGVSLVGVVVGAALHTAHMCPTTVCTGRAAPVTFRCLKPATHRSRLVEVWYVAGGMGILYRQQCASVPSNRMVTRASAARAAPYGPPPPPLHVWLFASAS